MFGRLGDASAADIDTAFGRQDNVHHLYLRYLVEHFSWLIAQACYPAHLSEGFSKDKCQKAHQNVRLNPFSLLVPYRADRQIALVNAKCNLSLSELDIGFPEFLGGPIRDVAPQQVAPLAQGRPIAPGIDL